MSARLSVNVNKYALLRNSRGRNVPDLLEACEVCVAAGAHGITVHPRLDQRHVRFDDVPAVARRLRERHPDVEFNVECELHADLLDLVCAVQPAQCTLVPVHPGEVTSDHGWDPVADRDALRRAADRLRAVGVRVSCFADCAPETMAAFARAGADRVELYTGPFAWAWATAEQEARTAELWATARAAVEAGLEVNAGHDLDRHNLVALRGLPGLREVSIGHAQICRALEVGTTRSVRELLEALG